MFKVKILTIGKLKETWLKEALFEYEKRMKDELIIEWRLAKSNAELFSWACQEPFIALDLKGAFLNSVQWHQKMMRFGLKLIFLIGPAEGIPEEILSLAQFRWSLSPLTFTHQMVRLILVEQLYRSIEIRKNSSYHK